MKFGRLTYYANVQENGVVRLVECGSAWRFSWGPLRLVWNPNPAVTGFEFSTDYRYPTKYRPGRIGWRSDGLFFKCWHLVGTWTIGGVYELDGR